MPVEMLSSPVGIGAAILAVLALMTLYYRRQTGSTEQAIETVGEQIEGLTSGILTATRAAILAVLGIAVTLGDQMIELFGIGGSLIADAPYLISNIGAIILGAFSTQLGLSSEQFVGMALAILGIVLLTREASEVAD